MPSAASAVAIRPNVNSPSELSNHSYGWAVDIDPELNPNIKKAKLPLDLIEAITGIDVYGRRNSDAAYARPLRCPVAGGRGALQGEQRFSRRLPRSERAEGRHGERGSAPLRHYPRPGRSRSRPCACDRGAGEDTRSGRAPHRARSCVGQSQVDGSASRRRGEVVRRAAAVHNPEIIGSDATVARFGFFNLAPEVTAGLAAADGGGLRWLGAARATKDFMHFELFAGDQPKLF